MKLSRAWKVACRGGRKGNGTSTHRGPSRLSEAHRTCPSLGFEGKTYWHEHKPEPVRGQALEEIVLAPSTRRSQTYWREHEPEVLGSSSRLAQGQALRNVLARAPTWGASRLIEACPRTGLGSKRIGTSTNPRRVEAHRGLAKNRPRQQNVMARARTRGASRLIEAWPRPGLGSKTHWQELAPRRRDPKLYNTIVGVPSHGWADSVSVGSLWMAS